MGTFIIKFKYVHSILYSTYLQSIFVSVQAGDDHSRRGQNVFDPINGDERWILTVNFQKKRKRVAGGEQQDYNVKPDRHKKVCFVCGEKWRE